MESREIVTPHSVSALAGPRDGRADREPGAARFPEHGAPGRTAQGWESRLLAGILRALGGPPLAIELWNGETVSASATPPVARIRILDRQTLWKVIADPFFQFGEGYSTGRIEIDGSLVETLLEIERALNRSDARSRFTEHLYRLVHRPRRNTLSGSRENVHQHYDLGNDFYRLWLDEQLIYTCAYFTSPERTLEQAQVDKLDHVCRKLRLAPGQQVIEAGCGWGALSLHMARHYGVRVTAYNISHEQVLYARERAAAEQLDSLVTFVEADWREITGECDAFVSVGMLEHVGVEHYERLGSLIAGCLRPHGRGLVHSIGRDRPARLDPWTERRIFPGAYVPSLGEMLRIFEPHQFSVLDVENLRLHYALTLRHWLERYERNVSNVRNRFGEEFVRVWRLYLCGSIAAFAGGSLQLFQILFDRGHYDGPPETRAELYVRRGAGSLGSPGS